MFKEMFPTGELKLLQTGGVVLLPFTSGCLFQTFVKPLLQVMPATRFVVPPRLYSTPRPNWVVPLSTLFLVGSSTFPIGQARKGFTMMPPLKEPLFPVG